MAGLHGRLMLQSTCCDHMAEFTWSFANSSTMCGKGLEMFA